MTEKEKYKPPLPTKGDAAHAVTRAGLGAIPIVGAAATEIFSAVVTPPLVSRRRTWMEEVGNGLKEVEEKMGVVLEDLQHNDAFIDAVMEASHLALRTSEKEKIHALRNAVLNASLPNPPEQSLQSMYFSFIDVFTAWHIKLLDLFRNPGSWLESHSKHFNIKDISEKEPLYSFVEAVLPELHGRKDFYDQVWKDLYLRGLVTKETFKLMIPRDDVVNKRTTDIGDGFLNFIHSPFDEAAAP